MAGWKRIEPFAGERDTAPVSLNGPAIRSLLLEYGFQEMRQSRRNKRGNQDVVGDASFVAAFATRIQPPSGSESADDMLIRSPRQKFGGLFR
jgi:hypothetical protein